MKKSQRHLPRPEASPTFLDHRQRDCSGSGCALRSYLDYSRMEFTRGPKYSSKYFIIEIVPRWVIKLEGTSRLAPLEACLFLYVLARARIIEKSAYIYDDRISEKFPKEMNDRLTRGEKNRELENMYRRRERRNARLARLCGELLREDGREGRKKEGRSRDGGTRRIQVGQPWRTEVPYGPRKPASALKPRARTSLSVSFRPFPGHGHPPSSRACNTLAFTTKRHRHTHAEAARNARE